MLPDDDVVVDEKDIAFELSLQSFSEVPNDAKELNPELIDFWVPLLLVPGALLVNPAKVENGLFALSACSTCTLELDFDDRFTFTIFLVDKASTGALSHEPTVSSPSSSDLSSEVNCLLAPLLLDMDAIVVNEVFESDPFDKNEVKSQVERRRFVLLKRSGERNSQYKI